MKLSLYAYPVPDPMAWKQVAFQQSWNDLSAYVFPPFAFLGPNLSLVLVAIL